MKFLDELEKVLKADERFIGEGKQVIKTKVSDAARGIDGLLIKSLLKNELMRESFFTKVDDVYVFDKVKFIWLLDSKEFLPDSYTLYKNKIGLVDNQNNLISQKQDVSLVWPYKECVLEGGQEKEDQKREEIFYNETLAPDEVNRLLAPKVLGNAKRYTLNDIEESVLFRKNDNLIIKGNNLMGLSSILKRYENDIKLIYIDPPYNTGSDSFLYNDNFNKSTWLTFLKNRLEISYKLLKNNGVIAVQCDYHQNSYLRVLMDEVFGAENYISEIAVKMSSASGPKMAHIQKSIPKLKDSILIYSKGEIEIITQPYKPKDKWDTEYSKILMDFSKKDRAEFETAIKSIQYDKAKEIIEKARLSTLSREFPDKKQDEDWLRDNAWRIVADKQNTGLDNLLSNSEKFWTGDVSLAKTVRGSYALFRTDKDFGSDTRVEIVFADNNLNEHVGDFWSDISTAGGFSEEGGINFPTAKKPEKLLKRIIQMFTEENEIVLDFFMGSATTQATSMKLRRQFIGIEQMDYIEDKAVTRLINTINGDQTGVSQDIDVNWKGGGAFVYCELLEDNQSLVYELEKATNPDSVKSVLAKGTKNGKLIPSVLPRDLKRTEEEFDNLTLDEQKKLVLELLDKNKLYINLSDVDDEDANVSEADKAFTKSFYGLD
ncbi:DNA methyltransferase [Kallipyga massiliensis]|uniref:DNA methyltransferase n=1 Tax=Kallipyga massiliensis TaxID=1472764 RepID=UPI0004B632A7|nr:site-specific DNA-methyltransferase [Kallipyga massiliensis]